MNSARLYEKEWKQVVKDEKAYLRDNQEIKAKGYQKQLDKIMPEKLQNTLNTAFYKAFDLVFEKGTVVIEKTYDKGKREAIYKCNERQHRVKTNRKTLRLFKKQENSTKLVNTAISAAEGIGFGLFGVGVPDIPIFLGVILKSIYEIALSYGYQYDTEEEQIFICEMIEASLSHGAMLYSKNDAINRWIDDKEEKQQPKERAIKHASDALTEELLYMKFLQTIPVIGVVGGISTAACLQKIIDFVSIKYRRRFFTDKINQAKKRC